MLRLNFCLFRKRLGGGLLGAVIRISLFSRKPRMGFSSASCRSATIRRPAAYKAAALPAELRRRNRSGMRNGGWAMRAKEFLSCDRFMPPIANYLPFGNPAFRMWPLGPSCFDGIRTRITPKTGHPDRLNDEAMLRIRCWRGGSVQTTEVQGPRLDHRSTSPQYGSGRVAALTSYSQVRCGSGRCIGHRPRLREGPAMHRSQNRQAFKTRMGGVDARVSASAFAGIRTRTGCVLGALPLPVGLRKHAQAIRRDMPAQSTVDSTTRVGSLHSCLRWTRILQHEA